jgi:Zinc finger, C2H2 type
MIGIMAAASNYRRSSSSPKELRCSICGRVFDSAETLNSHKRIDHSQEGYQPPAGVS